MNTQNSYKRGAFTLIELLVVIAIISVLAALLVPALNNGLTAARTITCASNLKQIQLAAFLYLRDHGVFPPHYDYRDKNGDGIADGPFWCYDGSIPNGVMAFSYFAGPYLAFDVVYGGSPTRGEGSVFDCPLTDGGVFFGTHGTHVGYGYNETVGSNHNYRQVGMEDIANPTKVIAFADTWGYVVSPDPFRRYWARPLVGIRYHADERFNAAFVDGHVLALYKEDVEDSNFEVQ